MGALPDLLHLEPGDRLGSYRIVEAIGAGGMGQVYLAERMADGARFALKTLPEAAAADAQFVTRFRDEAKVMAHLDHGNIVRVHDSGEAEGRYFYAMDYVAGPTVEGSEGAAGAEAAPEAPPLPAAGRPLDLQGHLDGQPGGRLPEADVRRWALQVVDALAYAHGQGVVHRDLKPANLLLDREWNVRLTDFGLAKVVGGDFLLHQAEHTMHALGADLAFLGEGMSFESSLVKPPSSAAMSILGTYDYMAPEQREPSAEVDARTDIYALGLILYRCLTGTLPPRGRAKRVAELVPGCSRRWDEIIFKCIESDPSDRYQSAAELGAALRKRERRLGWVAAALVLAAAGGAVYGTKTWESAARNSPVDKGGGDESKEPAPAQEDFDEANKAKEAFRVARDRLRELGEFANRAATTADQQWAAANDLLPRNPKEAAERFRQACADLPRYDEVKSALDARAKYVELKAESRDAIAQTYAEYRAKEHWEAAEAANDGKDWGKAVEGYKRALGAFGEAVSTAELWAKQNGDFQRDEKGYDALLQQFAGPEAEAVAQLVQDARKLAAGGAGAPPRPDLAIGKLGEARAKALGALPQARDARAALATAALGKARDAIKEWDYDRARDSLWALFGREDMGNLQALLRTIEAPETEVYIAGVREEAEELRIRFERCPADPVQAFVEELERAGVTGPLKVVPDTLPVARNVQAALQARFGDPSGSRTARVLTLSVEEEMPFRVLVGKVEAVSIPIRIRPDRDNWRLIQPDSGPGKTERWERPTGWPPGWQPPREFWDRITRRGALANGRHIWNVESGGDVAEMVLVLPPTKKPAQPGGDRGVPTIERAFLMDRYEVTLARYRPFERTGTTPRPGGWGVLLNPKSDDKRAIVNLRIEWAEAFAKWAHKELPNEEEWEYAALWDDDKGETREFPWGDRAEIRTRRQVKPPEVTESEGDCSYWGVRGMGTGVSEWCKAKNKAGAYVRGVPEYVTPGFEHLIPSSATDKKYLAAQPRLLLPHVGFRCIIRLEETKE